jgi:hypothetical protein
MLKFIENLDELTGKVDRGKLISLKPPHMCYDCDAEPQGNAPGRDSPIRAIVEPSIPGIERYYCGLGIKYCRKLEDKKTQQEILILNQER